MSRKLARLILVAAIGLAVAACGSDSGGVASLNTEGTQRADPAAIIEEEPPDDEAAVMAFVQCMGDEGIEFKDPAIDSGGDVQRPELVEGVTYPREELAESYEACSHHLEGLTFGRGREDVAEQVDHFVALATCLRDKGYDVDNPTAETLDQWGADFRVEFDWDDPEAQAAYEECSGAD